MNIYEEIRQMLGNESSERKMYRLLNTEQYRDGQYWTSDLQEDMELVKQSINGWWKPRFLLDHRNQCAYEFMCERCGLRTVTDNDIEWDSLKDLPEDVVARAIMHDGHFPVIFYQFQDGECQVEWQLNPDGRYYMDEDGYGMTDDVEIALIGAVDRTGKVVRKFKYHK